MLHAHTCGKCGTRWSHSENSPGSDRAKHTCPRCKSWPWVEKERVNQMRRYAPRRYLAACCATECDYQQCFGSGCSGGQTCGSGGQTCGSCWEKNLTCTVMKQAGDANSTSAGGTLPATGQPAAGATPTTPAAPAPGIMANLTNFSTPYPYIAIGGVILAAALLMPGGRKAGNSPAPNVFHYG